MEVNIEGFLDELVHVYPEGRNEIEFLEKQFSCKIQCNIEKHNALQHTYYYEVDFGKNENYFIEIESGINNGTVIQNSEWGNDTKTNTKEAEILADIKLDDSFYVNDSFLRKKAQSLLESNKEELFEFYRKDSYDNYVTGGNSKLQIRAPLNELRLSYLYKTQEVYRTFC